MRKSLLFMLGVSVIWILLGIALSSQESIDKFGYAETAGSAVGSLVFVWAGYGLYLLFIRNKKPISKKTSV